MTWFLFLSFSFFCSEMLGYFFLWLCISLQLHIQIPLFVYCVFLKFFYYPKVSLFVGFEYHWSTVRTCLSCSLFNAIFLKFEEASSITLLLIKAPIRHSSSTQDTCSMKFLNAVKIYLYMCSMLELKL